MPGKNEIERPDQSEQPQPVREDKTTERTETTKEPVDPNKAEPE
jgi:hypothetical protein